MAETTKKIAILAADGFEATELIYPYYRLKEAGYDVQLLSLEKKVINSENGYPMAPDLGLDELDEELIESFDGVVIPGGIRNSDMLRRSKEVLDFIKTMDQTEKIVAAIGYAGWVLISAKILTDRKATSYYSIRHDMKNVCKKYENSPVVIDRNLITSRMSIDLPEFMKAILDYLK